MARPCTCDNCPKDGPFVGNKGFCYNCWRYWNVPKFKAECDGTAPPKEKKPAQTTSLGNAVPRRKNCCD